MSELTPQFIAKTRETKCTVWIGSTNSKGYGLISQGGKAVLAHRVAFEAEYGPIPEGMVIDHLCRVRRPNGTTECRTCRAAGSHHADRHRPTTQKRAPRVASDLGQVDGGAA